MTPEQVFSIANPVAALGWLILILAGRKRWAAGLVAGVVIPLLLSVVYVALLFEHWGEGNGGFGTLAGVAELFANHGYCLQAGFTTSRSISLSAVGKCATPPAM